MIAKSALLRRRAVLQFAVGAAGTATILCASPNAARAAPKISKAAVAYQDHPNGDKRCDKVCAVSAAGRMQDGRGPDQSTGFLPHFHAAPPDMSC